MSACRIEGLRTKLLLVDPVFLDSAIKYCLLTHNCRYSNRSVLSISDQFRCEMGYNESPMLDNHGAINSLVVTLANPQILLRGM